ncbi:sec-independent protein translocase protein TatA [Paenibacillus anaericanus]|nr:sec-independent protein translocase protein TatA [Paenibacillus anaericanus]
MCRKRDDELPYLFVVSEGETIMGAGGLLLIIIAALLLFGPNKLPELGRAVGRTYREFKEATRDIVDDGPEVKKPEASAAVKSESPKPDDRRLPE